MSQAERDFDAATDRLLAEVARMTAEALALAKMGGSLHKAKRA